VLQIVNMIPKSLSGETDQDSEPNLAVNPEQPNQIVATAFTQDPMNGNRAPVYVSQDACATWSLRPIVPGGPGTADITVGFGSRGGALYAGILNFTTFNFNVLRTANPFALTPMKLLVDRPNEDQPWVSAITAHAGANDHDQVYVGHNDFGAQPATASVELSRDAGGGEPPAGFKTHAIEGRPTLGQDGPPVRPAAHVDGTVYVAFQRWVKVLPSSPSDVSMDVVVARDDQHGRGPTPFRALVDSQDGKPGVRVAKGRFIRFTSSTGPLGQERIGADLAIAVDPSNSDNVWLAWCDRVGGATGTDWTMHVCHSTDRGQTWGNRNLRTVTNAKNPTLAVNANGLVGLMFQQLVGAGPAGRWVTQLETTGDAWATAPRASCCTPPTRRSRRAKGCPTWATTSACSRWAPTSTGSSRARTGRRRPTSPTASPTSATPTSPPRRCSAPTTPRRSTSRSIRSSSGTRPQGREYRAQLIHVTLRPGLGHGG
jgi:hypothetical protein